MKIDDELKSEHTVLKRMEWIKVEDRLPEHYSIVLAYGISTYGVSKREKVIRQVLISYNIGGDLMSWDLLSSGCGCCDSDLENVTHWMPLPEPPKD